MKIINDFDWDFLRSKFETSEPFNHVVIDNFFTDEVARNIFKDMPGYDADLDAKYDNAIEKKRTVQNWTKFSKNIYTAMTELVSQEFTKHLRYMTNEPELVADFGLHGGGIHLHQSGDYLNVHLDYDIHPKLDMKRKLNIIVYLNPNWKEEWGGNLGMWSHDNVTGQPKELIKSVAPAFNRALVFDTTQNSWHGVTEGITAPEGEYRKSLALYYLIPTTDLDNKRQKALFVPRQEQKGDKDVEDLIKTRMGY
jgi:Rps23 Pro-64 3,4-dihydroxylase Tpa1-like proline 4-hydroxylase